jgi:DNA-binding XRE family transcriptional regulator
MSENRSKVPDSRHSVSVPVRLFAENKYQLQGKIIRILRISAEMSQQQLADSLGTSRGTIIDIEKRGAVDGVQLFAIAQILGVSVSIFNPDAGLD